MALLADLEPFFRVTLLGLALLLTVLLAVATRRTGSGKLLLVTLGFFAFFVKGLVLTLGIFLTPFDELFRVSPELLAVDFLILVLLYAGTVKGT